MKRWRHVVQPFAGLAAMALLLAGCGTPGAGSRPPLRLSNWWSTYERGKEAMLAGDLAAARQNFELCLGLRSGIRFEYPVDRWRVRTYGFHFMENYFPNRELGITLFLLGDAAGAVPLLEKSNGQEPSERARFYLDQARAKLVAVQPGLPPPVIRMDPLPAALSRREVNISGVATGEAYVEGVSVGRSIPMQPGSARQMPFSVTAVLKPGLNEVPVVARDLRGRETRTSVQIISDTVGPCFTASHATRLTTGWRLQVDCSDLHGLRSVRWGERELFKTMDPAPTQAEWTLDIRPDSPPIEAVDLAGNRTVWSWRDELLPDLVASWIPVQSAQTTGIAADTAVGISAAQLKNDQKNPVIKIGGVATTMVVHEPYFYLDGAVTDGGGLASLTVDGEELIPAEKKGCESFRFATEIQARLGTNRVVVAASDRAGNRSEFAFTLAYFIPEYEAMEHRLRVSVPPFRVDELEKAPAGRGELLSSLMAGKLLRKEEPRFRVLERNGDEWKAILQEQDLSLSDLVDERARLRLSRITPADLMLVGRTFLDRGGITLFAQVVETVDGRILFSEDVYSENMAQEMDSCMSALVSKLERRFPLITGAVVEVAGRSITLNLGKLNGVNPGCRFLLIGPEGEPQWDEVKRDHGIPIEAIPSRISGERTRAIVPIPANERIKEGDRVYSR